MYTGHTQNNGVVLIVFTIKTAPFFCVCPVYNRHVVVNGCPMHKKLYNNKIIELHFVFTVHFCITDYHSPTNAQR
jgi:hypothetical protein